MIRLISNRIQSIELTRIGKILVNRNFSSNFVSNRQIPLSIRPRPQMSNVIMTRCLPTLLVCPKSTIPVGWCGGSVVVRNFSITSGYTSIKRSIVRFRRKVKTTIALFFLTFALVYFSIYYSITAVITELLRQQSKQINATIKSNHLDSKKSKTN